MYDERIIIAGSRIFDDYDFLEEKVNAILSANEIRNPLIISGHAKGADTLGEEYAINHGYDLILFPAQWKDENGVFDRAAGIKRNVRMAENATALIAFHRNNSPGTAHIIKYAKSKGLKVKVIEI